MCSILLEYIAQMLELKGIISWRFNFQKNDIIKLLIESVLPKEEFPKESQYKVIKYKKFGKAKQHAALYQPLALGFVRSFWTISS